MTDEQWLDLIEWTSAEDLSLAQIEELLQSLKESPLLSAAFSARIERKQYLAAALGRVNASVDEALTRPDSTPESREKPLLPLVAWTLCLTLIGCVGLVLLLLAVAPPVNDGPRERAVQQEITIGHDAGDESAASPSVSETEAPIGAAAPARSEAADPASLATGSQVEDADPAAENRPGERQGTSDAPVADEPPKAGATPLFEEIDSKAPAPREEDLKRWFGEVPGLAHNVSRKDYFGNACGALDGVWRLRAPLKPRTALRLTLADYQHLQLHFWRGAEGATLHYYENARQTWAAYRTTRDKEEARPKTIVLAATDEDRYWRTNPAWPATFEIRADDGAITLVRGDVKLLSVPFEGAIDEVYFDGRATFRQIKMVRAADLPTARPERPTLADIHHPAELEWSAALAEGADFRKLADGRVELSGEKNAHPVWVSAELPLRESLCEIVLRIDQPRPGSGVFLGDDQGPRYRIGFYRDGHRGEISYGFAPLGDARVDSNHDPDNQIVPFAAESGWYRLLLGCGTFKVWTSVDGIHWARAFDPPTNQRASYSRVGLYCLAGQTPKSIKLGRLQLRELAALDGLAPIELRRQAPVLNYAADMHEWRAAVLSSQPAAVDAADWRRACALRTLAAGATADLGTPLVDSLVDEVLADPKFGPTARLSIVDEAALLYPTWDDPKLALHCARWYERIGRQAERQGQTRPCSLIEHAQRTAPIWSRHIFNFLPDALARYEVIELAEEHRWPELRDFCNRERFWRRLSNHHPTPPSLFDWGGALASRQLSQQPGHVNTAVLNQWRHPLLVELSKEGYNVLAEFRAAVDNGAYRDACQIISTSPSEGLLGLLPDAHDPDLMLTLSGAVALAMREQPALRATMNNQFGSFARLRVRQAIAERNVARVEAAAIQFFGTAGAAEAHLWLGDRALSSGAFGQALGQYRQARPTAAPELQDRIAAGQRLASASMGLAVAGPAVTHGVVLGDTKLSPAELDALVTDLRTHRGADNPSARGDSSPAFRHPAPAPSGFKTILKFRLEGDSGNSPQNVPAEMAQFNVDWVARQLATVIDGDRLIVSNRFQVAAYDLKAGRLQWRSELGAEHGPAHDWPLMPMRPLIAAGCIFARRLQRGGPLLACFNSADGKVLWSTKVEPDNWVVADPLLIQDELFAVTMSRSDQEFALSLTKFDPQSGAALASRPLVRLRDSWWRDRSCQAAANGDELIVACGGAVLACDLLGHVRWVRRQTWLPASLDRPSLAQSQDPPLLAEGRAYVAQPGVHAIVAMETDSGLLLWRRVLPSVRRLIGRIDQRLIVEIDAGFIALDAASGKILWHHDADNRLDALLCGAPGGLLYAKAEPVRNENNWRPTLVWVDPASGRVRSQARLASLKHDRPKLGPLVTAGGRCFAFFGRGDEDPSRDVVELVANAADLDKRRLTDLPRIPSR